MKLNGITVAVVVAGAWVAGSFATGSAAAHDGHGSHGGHGLRIGDDGGHGDPDGGTAPARAPLTARAQGSGAATTGSGRFTFRHLPIELPAAMQEHLVKAHGGFAVDAESHGGDGSVYFALSGVGLLRLRADLSGIDVVGGAAAFRDVNLHNTCLFRERGVTYLALPSDQAQRVFLTDRRGHLIRTFPNPYGEGGAPFRVCDVEVIDGRLFAANGYADNVVFVTNPFRGSEDDPATGTWGERRFGGKGKAHGRFGTAHGVTRVPATDVMTIADRANSRLESYSVEGNYIGGIALPDGCLPCDVDYLGRHAVVGCLKGPGGSTPAPIYILEDGNVVAELNLGRDLGLPGFTHIHNAAFRVRRDAAGEERLYVLAYAWNPGNFAVLEQVKE